MNNFTGLLIALGLVLLNAFFVATEFALVSVRRSRIEALIEEGNATARVVRSVISNLDRYIAATQLGITVTSLGLGWVGEPALGHLIEPLMERVLEPIGHLLPAGAVQTTSAAAIGGAIGFLIITFMHVVMGELMPKSIALQNPEVTALWVVRPIVLLARVFHLPIRALNGTGNALLRLIGVRPAQGHQLVHSVEELKILIRSSAQSGVLAGGEDDIMEAVFDMGETRARQLMVPRTEIVAFRADTPLAEVIDRVAESNLTKFPVYEEDLDQTIGILHTKDLLRVVRQNGMETTLRDLVRPALFVPESITISDLLNRFRQERQHLALLLDEYGGTAGLITLEDLLEELVGDVQDAFEPQAAEIEVLPDGSALLSGLTPIEEVNERFGLNLSDPNYETIAGYILGRLDRIAQLGDTVEVDNVELAVAAMDGLRIDRVRLTRRPPAAESADESAPAPGEAPLDDVMPSR
ncbi:MAG: HlyC/CorC family transporter [Anaerolineae bacterium]|nr:HlyC/CorC family transporter [Anaerolineae bacterium]